jgi:hypothetical protein
VFVYLLRLRARFLSLVTVLSVLSLTALGADTHTTWEKQIGELAEAAEESDARHQVLLDLDKWAPERPGHHLWKIPAWFVDLTCTDPSFASIVGAYILPSVIDGCAVASGFSLPYSVGAISRVFGATFEVLRNICKLPRLFLNGEGSGQSVLPVNPVFTKQDVAKSSSAFMSHVIALNGTMTDSCVGANMLWSNAYKGLSIVFAGGVGLLAIEGDFIDVALRSLKRKYWLKTAFYEGVDCTVTAGYAQIDLLGISNRQSLQNLPKNEKTKELKAQIDVVDNMLAYRANSSAKKPHKD